MEDVPDVNNSGDTDLEDLVAYLVEERLRQQRRPQGEPVIINPNGDTANFTNGRESGR